MKKIVTSFIALIFLTGCWNYQELNNYSIVTGIAIDKHNNEYEVAVLIANSPKNNTDNSENSSKVVVYSGYGKSIFSAIKDIGLISAKELYLGHFSVLLISEEVAKDGINNVVDLFLRESSSKKNFYIAITKDCKAKDALKIITPLSNYSSQNISDNLSSTTKLQGIISNIDFNELLSNLKRPGVENAINSIIIIGNAEEGSSKKNIETSEPSTYIKLGPLGLFKDDKLVYWTDDDESIGINIVRNKTKEMYVIVKYYNSTTVIDNTELKTNINVSLENKLPKVNISISGEGKLVEVTGDVDITSSKVINSLNQKLNLEIEKYIQKGIMASFNNNTDVFGFGLMFYREYPNYYDKVKNNWQNELRKIKININSNIILKTRGSSQISLEDKND